MFSYLVALKSLQKNKLQTILTMVGMMIGVATVVTMIALGSGAQKAIQDQVRAAGMNLITVTAGNYQVERVDDSGSDGMDGPATKAAFHVPSRGQGARLASATWDPNIKLHKAFVFVPNRLKNQLRPGDFKAGHGAAETLTMDDVDAIQKLSGIQFVSSGLHGNINAIAGDKRYFTRMHGEGTEIIDIRRGWALRYGRFYTRREQNKAAHVVVLGDVASKGLFGDTNPVGKTVTIKDQPFEVIGVVATNTWMVPETEGDDQFDAVYIPITTVQQLLKISYLSTVTITTSSTGDVTPILKAVTELLRKRHGITLDMPDDFIVSSQARKAMSKGGVQTDVARAVMGNVNGLEKVTLEELGKTLDRASTTMTALLVSVATVSMVVGGIGIMNIMLLSVTERTREIGIRRAVGARSDDVMKQFLYEAITLSLSGGILGILVGVIISISITQFVHWSTNVSGLSIIISFGISAMVGIFFGYYPAREASRVSPMDSLRYE
ncbi:FtsX-like permease family protein [Granulicella sp. WH15]|uniref:ABC transporter permease n=1 Tax=Granulicella sp. WH15 TaxID=2602070 RepID=UPI001366AE1F|nr:ABC transporter permease [Granulicella sp. WH15]QHN04515.1 FtsX-like permease family protein [Granulicella sp. WH15]